MFSCHQRKYTILKNKKLQKHLQHEISMPDRGDMYENNFLLLFIFKLGSNKYKTNKKQQIKTWLKQ